jgi:hypothetical protein
MVKSRNNYTQKKGIKQGKSEHPNPDIEKIDVVNHEDLERIFLK